MRLFYLFLFQIDLHYCIEMPLFCVLILRSATFLNLLISSNSFLTEYLRFSFYRTMSSETSVSVHVTFFCRFNPPFLVQMPFTHFSCLISLTGTSSFKWVGRGRVGTPVLFLILHENLAIFIMNFYVSHGLVIWPSCLLDIRDDTFSFKTFYLNLILVTFIQTVWQMNPSIFILFFSLLWLITHIFNISVT